MRCTPNCEIKDSFFAEKFLVPSNIMCFKQARGKCWSADDAVSNFLETTIKGIFFSSKQLAYNLIRSNE